MTLAAGSRAAAITGWGAVSALGTDCAQLWQAIDAGVCGIGDISRFSTAPFSVRTGAVAMASAPRSSSAPELLTHADIGLALALPALCEAMAHGRLDQRAPRTRVALVFGTGLAFTTPTLHAWTSMLAESCGITGPCLAVSTACSSSTGAIVLARHLLLMDAADVVIAGGADVLTPEVFAGFHALGVLSHGACAPFSVPPGTSLGEGAGFLVIERPATAAGRGVAPLAWLSGGGLSCDAVHETSPDPTGAGIERAIRAAMADAGVAGAAIGYVNAHGSGTTNNDAAEWLGIQRALGSRDTAVPVSSTKGALGHAQGAAGVLEAIVTLIAMQHDCLPPTLNFVGARPYAPPDPVPGPAPRRARVEQVVTVNAAFGGANAALVLSRTPPADAARPRRAVRLRTLATVRYEHPEDGEGVQWEWAERLGIPDDELRRCDPSAVALTCATATALREAGVRITAARRDRTGLFVGQLRPSPQSLTRFDESIATHGLAQLSASAFARIVMNAAAGSCARLLSLRGAHTVLSAGAGSGLAALILAAEHLATHDDVDRMLAAAVDEGTPEMPIDRRHQPVEARCTFLEAVPDSPGDGTSAVAAITVRGWGVADRAHLAHAIHRAAPDGLPRGSLSLAVDDILPRDDRAVRSLEPVARAIDALRANDVPAVLVTDSTPGALSLALLLTR